MPALDRERKIRKMSDHTVVDLLAFPVKAAVRGYCGAIAVLDAGLLAPARTAPGLIAVGVFEFTVDNTAGKDGDLVARIRQGTFAFFNSGAADAILQADVGKDCFLVDDQTVAKTDGGASRSRGGKILGFLDETLVWVQLGIGL